MELYWPILLITSIVAVLIYYIFIAETRFQKHGVPTPRLSKYMMDTIRILLKKLSIVDNIQNAYDTYKNAKYVGFYDFGKSVVMIRDLELIKNVTVKNFENFTDHRTFIDPDVEPLFGDNLVALKGDKWKEVRSLLSPAFTSSKMKGMFKLMSQCAERFANYIVEKSAKEPIDENSKDIFTRYTNDTIATCAFGVAVDSMSDPNNEFYVLGKKATSFDGFNIIKFMLLRFCPRLCSYLGVKLISNDVERFFYKLVRETIATRDEKGIFRPDMLQLMMETRNQKPESKGPELSIESMTSQAFIFFFGGFDTTSTHMCFAVHEIAANPEVCEKLQSEIDEVYQKHGNLTYEIVNKMEYLDAVINEALRLYPIGVMIDRLCTKSFELPPALPGSKPFVLKPGDGIGIPVWAIHRDPEYFAEPDKFLPERFLDAKDSNNTSAYMPFGVGPRMCIGNRFALLETKVLIIHLLRKCTVKISKKMIMPLKISTTTLNLSADGGFWLELKPRECM